MKDKWTTEELNQMRTFYEENGYLVIPQFASAEEMDELKDRSEQLIENFFNSEESKKHISVFTTRDQVKKSDEYFVQSGDKVRFFFEEGAFDDKGNLKVLKSNSINKIGHALGELDPLFRKFTFQPAACSLVKALGMKDPLLAQSMYIFKQPKIGGYVNIHQDSTFMNTKPLSCMAFWYAVEDVTRDNGCIWVVPGSHKEGITNRFKRNADGTATVMTKPDPEECAPWSSLKEQFKREKNPDQWVPVVCPKGSLVVIHGCIVHYSEQNRSEHSRHAYTFHMVEADAVWSPENWLQRPKEMPFVQMDPLNL